MSMRQQSGNHTTVTLSKPPSGHKTVASPRARGQRAPNKMGDSFKDKEKDLNGVIKIKDKEKDDISLNKVGNSNKDKEKDLKGDFDKESVPLSEKEAHADKKDIFRTDSILSNGDLDPTCIPNAVTNDLNNEIIETNIDTPKPPGSDPQENTDANEVISTKDNKYDDGNTGSENIKNGQKQEEGKKVSSVASSTLSISTKDSKSDKIKSSKVSVNSKDEKDSEVKGSTVSVNSKESKSNSVTSKEFKSQSSKGSTVSVNTKDRSEQSLKTASNKSEVSSVRSFKLDNNKEKDKDSKSIGSKKGKSGTKTEKINLATETKVTITDSTYNETTSNTLSGGDCSPQTNNINNVNQQEKISLTVPGQVGDGKESKGNALEATRKDSIVSDKLRRESTKFSMGSRKSIDLRVQYTTVQMPTTEDKTKPSVYATEDSWIRIAIPYLPVSLAIFCLFMNICVPGSGTMISGFSIFCCAKSRVPPKYDQDILLILCVNIWVGVAQLFTVSFLLVGWFWSLAWGVKMVILAVERRQELKDQRAKELQTLALKAFGSSIPAAHITPMTS